LLFKHLPNNGACDVSGFKNTLSFKTLKLISEQFWWKRRLRRSRQAAAAAAKEEDVARFVNF
jgi:hypothetical protein